LDAGELNVGKGIYMKRISYLVLISSVLSFFHCSSQISTHKKENDDGIRRIVSPLILNISFYDSSDSLTKESYNVLDKIYNIMEKYSEDKYVIAGHTQKSGNEETEISLSYKRAKTVFDYLISSC
jgi:outer membrane protein OmpA-like peptidoglycan-associated protein